MVDPYQSEEERVETLKRWWRDNGKSVIAGVVIGIAAVLGWRYWQDYRSARTAQASLGFDRLVAAINEGRLEAARQQATLLKGHYESTPYATLAALASARLHVEAGELHQAKNELGWAIQNAPSSGIADVARIRLARVLLAEEKLDEALAMLDAIASGAFTAIIEEIRGDVLRRRGDRAAAGEAYRRALMAGTANRRVVEMKLADLGLSLEGTGAP